MLLGFSTLSCDRVSYVAFYVRFQTLASLEAGHVASHVFLQLADVFELRVRVIAIAEWKYFRAILRSLQRQWMWNFAAIYSSSGTCTIISSYIKIFKRKTSSLWGFLGRKKRSELRFIWLSTGIGHKIRSVFIDVIIVHSHREQTIIRRMQAYSKGLVTKNWNGSQILKQQLRAWRLTNHQRRRWSYLGSKQQANLEQANSRKSFGCHSPTESSSGESKAIVIKLWGPCWFESMQWRRKGALANPPCQYSKWRQTALKPSLRLEC